MHDDVQSGIYPNLNNKNQLEGILSRWEAWNRRLLLAPKLIYFCIGLAYYVFYSFRIKFFKRFLQFSEPTSGFIQALIFLTSFLGLITWSHIADRTGRHKTVLIILIVGMALVFQGLWLNKLISSTTMITSGTSSDAWRLALAVIVGALYGFFSGGIMPLTDYQILKLLRNQFQVDDTFYGRQVLWGTIAAGLITFGMGSLIDVMGVQIILYAMPLIALLAIIVISLVGYPDVVPSTSSSSLLSSPSSRTPSQSKGTFEEFPRKESPLSSIWDYFHIFLTARFVLFILLVLVIGFGRQTAAFFLPFYLSEELGMLDGQYGRAYLVSSISSLLPLYFGPQLLRRLGIYPMLLVGLFAMTLRLLAFAFVIPLTCCPHQVLLVELFKSLSYGFTHLAGVQEAALCAPPGLETSFQAVYTAAYGTVPAIICSIFGGIVYGRAGGKALFKLVSLFSGGSFILLSLIAFSIKSRLRTQK